MSPLYTVNGAGLLVNRDGVANVGAGAPGTPTITLADLPGELDVSIVAPASNGALVFAYLVLWTGPTSGSATVPINVTGPVTEYSIVGLQSGQNYTVSVHAINVYGFGPAATLTGDPEAAQFDPRAWDPITGTGPSGSLTAITQSQAPGPTTAGILNLAAAGETFSGVHIASNYWENPAVTTGPYGNSGGIGIVEPNSPSFSLKNAQVDVPVHVDTGINNSNVTLGVLPVIQDAAIAPDAIAAIFENNKDGALMGFGGLVRRVLLNGSIDQMYPIGNSVYDEMWITGRANPSFEGGAWTGLPPGDIPQVASGNRPIPPATVITLAQAQEIQSIAFHQVAGTTMSGVQGNNPSTAFFRAAESNGQYAFQVVPGAGGKIDASPGLPNVDQVWASWPKNPYTKVNPGDTTQPFTSSGGVVTSLYPNQTNGEWNGTWSLYAGTNGQAQTSGAVPGFTATTTGEQNTITLPAALATAFSNGQISTLVGPNVSPGTVIQSVSGTTATLSQPFTANQTNGTYTAVMTATVTPSSAVLISNGNVNHSDGIQVATDIQQHMFFRGHRNELNSNSCRIFQNFLTGPGLGGRTDASATGSASSPTISDPAIGNQDVAKPVTGTNIPAGSYVGTPITPGTSFTLVNAAGTAVNPAGAVSGISVNRGNHPGGPYLHERQQCNPMNTVDYLNIEAQDPLSVGFTTDPGSYCRTNDPAATPGTWVPNPESYCARPWGACWRDLWIGPEASSYLNPAGLGPATLPNTLNDIIVATNGLTWNPVVYVPSEYYWLLAMCKQYGLPTPVALSAPTAQAPDTQGTYSTSGLSGAPGSGTSIPTSGTFVASTGLANTTVNSQGCNLYAYTGLSGNTLTGVTLLAGVPGYTVPAGADVVICDQRMLRMLDWSDFDASLADQTKPYATKASDWYIPWNDPTMPPVVQAVLDARYQAGLPPARCGAEGWYIWKNICRTDLGGANPNGLLLPKLWQMTALGQNFAGDAVYVITITGAPTGGSFTLTFAFPVQTTNSSGKTTTTKTTYTTAPISISGSGATAAQVAAAVLAAKSSAGTTFSNDVPGAQFASATKGPLPSTVVWLHTKYQIYDLFASMTGNASGLTGGSGCTVTMVKQPPNNLPAGPGHDIQWQQAATSAPPASGAAQWEFPGYVRYDL